jgi:hypothetical protein
MSPARLFLVLTTFAAPSLLACRGTASTSPDTETHSDDPDGTETDEVVDTLDSVVAPDTDDTDPPVPPLPSLALGSLHGCALLLDGRLSCWGASPGPTDSAGDDFDLDVANTFPEGQFSQLATWDFGGFVIERDGITGHAWGTTSEVRTEEFAASAPVVHLDVYAFGWVWTSMCWVDAQGALGCVGNLANGAPTTGTWRGVDVGRDVACAWRVDGTWTCWGARATIVGELASQVPTVQSVDAGSEGLCVVGSDGLVKCAGEGPLASTPTGQVVQASTFGEMGCAVRADSGLVCWGASGKSPDWLEDTPATTGFVEVEVGVDYACAIAATGAVSCWGEAAYGRTEPPESP